MRAAPGAIAVGRAARAEDERRGRGLGGEAGTVREDEQAAVEALPKFHATARVGAAAGQLHPAGAEADGVVVGDAARVPTAQPGGEIARGHPSALGERTGGPRSGISGSRLGNKPGWGVLGDRLTRSSWVVTALAHPDYLIEVEAPPANLSIASSHRSALPDHVRDRVGISRFHGLTLPLP